MQSAVTGTMARMRVSGIGILTMLLRTRTRTSAVAIFYKLILYAYYIHSPS